MIKNIWLVLSLYSQTLLKGNLLPQNNFLQDKDMSAKFFALFTTNITVNYFFAKNFISKTYKKHIV